jgi:hypothetical protein
MAAIVNGLSLCTMLGLMIGIAIATVVGRLIWPVLPQRVLKDNLLALFAQIKALLSGDPHRQKIQAQLAILPVEALQAARQIRIAGCPEEERGEACRSGSRATNLNNSDHPVTFSPRRVAGNHRTNTKTAI